MQSHGRHYPHHTIKQARKPHKTPHSSLFGKRRPVSSMPAALITLLALLVSCGGKPSAFTPAERKAADSLVASVRSTDSLAMLQKRLESGGDKLGSVAALREMGKRLRNESRFEEALQAHSSSLRQAEEIGDTLERVRALNNIGTDYRRMGVLDVAQEYHYRAWLLSSECADPSPEAVKNRVVSLNGLGNIYLTLGNYERADSALRMALEGEKRIGSAVGQAINYANIGSIFEHRGRTDSAWAYYRRSMELNRKAGSVLGVALCHTYFGSLHKKAGSHGEAADEYGKAYRLMSESKDDWHSLNILIALADIRHATGRFAEEAELLGRAERVAVRIKSPEHLAEIHTLYYRLHKQTGDSRAALASYEKASAMRDSVLDAEKMNRIQNTGLNIERKHQERAMGEAMLELERERAARHTGYIVFAFIAIAAAGAGAAFLHIQRIQRRNHLALKKLAELRENFFTNITHELRTPLTIILGLSRDLQAGHTEDVGGKARSIERQGKGLLALINQLLDISKIKSSVGQADWRHGDITAHLAMIVDSWREYAASRGIGLEFKAVEAVQTDFVPEYANKLLNNLLSNAFKFTPGQGRVCVSARREGGCLAISVEDTGKGMDGETLAHVFEPFYQAENGARHNGTGVGLALVKQIVDAVDGSITVESAPGKGTAFHISLPILHQATLAAETAEAVGCEEQPGTEDGPELEDSGEDGGCRLLIIEDNRDIAAYIGAQFDDGYAVSYACNGTDGLEKAQQSVPDLIITDLMMPGMDGLEVCRRVRGSDITSHIPIIIVTAKATEQERIRGFEAGADAYLAKPFNADELRTVAEKLLEGRRLLRSKYAGEAAEGNGGGEQAPEPIPEADRRFLTKMADAVHSQLSRNKGVDVSQIASSLCMSPRQFHRKMVALTGHTPTSYIQRIKIRKAKQLIDRNPQMGFGEVAELSGFGDYSNFVRAFKNVCGVTPTEYKREGTP